MAAVEVIEIKGDASSAIAALKAVGIEANKTTTAAQKSNEAINDGLEALDKQTNGAVSAFRSLQGGIKSAISAFTTLKGAIIATGLGALLVAVTSLVTYFKETERGGDQLAEVMGFLGAAVKVVIDRVILLGESLFKLFSGDFKGAIEGVTGAFKGLGDEIARESKLGRELAKQLIDVEDAERALIAQRAIANKQIAEARLIADDVTKSTEQRIAAVKRAGAIEERVARQELAVQRQRLSVLEQQAKMGEMTEEGLVRIEEARARISELEQANIMRRRRLQTETIGLLNEEIAKTKELEKARQDAEKVRFEDSEKKFKKYVDDSVKAANVGAGQVARVGQFYADAIAEGTEKTSADLQDYINFTLANLDAVSQAISGFAALAGENTKLSKALAISQIVIDTYMGATKALGAYPPPFGAIAAAGVIAGGIANLNKVKSTQIPTSASAAPTATISAPTAASQPPQFNIVGQSGVNQLAQSIGGQFDRPLRAYVVSQDISTAQQLQRQRVRTATFG
jgi:hypothetical protein